MKKSITLAVALLMCWAFDATASHLAGAEIWYTHISGQQYRINLIVYRDVSGIPLDPIQSICARSSCFGNQVIPLTNTTQSPPLPTPGLSECVNANDPNLVVTEIHSFEALVTLQGNCADWTFSWHENARNGSTNLAGGGDLYVEALLNNTLGTNSSPQFVTPAAKSFCLNQKFIWSQAAIEPDGDSVLYTFTTPLTTNGAVCNTPNPMTFATGYSVNAPMTTANGISINANNGTFTFTPSNVETVTIAVQVEEFRFDPTQLQWLMIGSSIRDLQVPIVANCIASAQNGPRIDVSTFGTTGVSRDSLLGYGLQDFADDQQTTGSNGDSIVSLPIVNYNCYDNSITLTFDIDIYCQSISPDGTDFRIVGPDTIARPVTGVVDNCQVDLTTRSIDLLLHKPLDVNGDYFLYVKKGNDGNTLTNRCGFELPDFYTIAVRVNNCPLLDYELENVSVENDRDIRLDWRADPSTYNPNLFNEWSILRANDDNDYYPIASLNKPNDHTARTYLDTSLGNYEVDNQIYQYAVQLIQNFDFKAPTNQIRSIVLKDELESGNLRVQWNDYNGWANPDYELWQGQKDISTQQVNWDAQPLASGNSNFLDHLVVLPQVTSSNAGIYALQVSATDPSGQSAHTSWSNVIFYELAYDSIIPPINPEQPVVPTVFTPNGDLVNETFYMTVDAEFTDIEVSVYNRWGGLVFQDSDYANRNSQESGWDGTDFNSGQKLADGVYYYTIRLFDPVSSTEENLKGSITILSGSN